METIIVMSKRVFEFAKDAQGQVIKDANGLPTLSDKPLVDKNNKRFCVLEFGTPDTVYTRNSKGQMQALAQPQKYVGGYTAWEISNLQSLKGKPDFGWDLEVMQEVVGTIVKRRVEEYKVGDRMVSTASVVTFANSEDKEGFELDVVAQFNRKGHKLAGVANQVVDAQVVQAATAPTSAIPAATTPVDAQAITAG